MTIDDISGTRAKSFYNGVAKDIMRSKDIDGTTPKFEKLKPKPYDLMDVSDVNGKRRAYESMRNPLNPVYNYSMNLGQSRPTNFGEIEGSRPKVLIKDIQ
jgi:hypothetical protein